MLRRKSEYPLLEALGYNAYEFQSDDRYGGVDIVYYFKEDDADGKEYKIIFRRKMNFGPYVYDALVGRRTPGYKNYLRIREQFKSPMRAFATIIAILKVVTSHSTVKGVLLEVPEDRFGQYSPVLQKLLVNELHSEYGLIDQRFMKSEYTSMGLTGHILVVRPFTFSNVFTGKDFVGIVSTNQNTVATDASVNLSKQNETMNMSTELPSVTDPANPNAVVALMNYDKTDIDRFSDIINQLGAKSIVKGQVLTQEHKVQAAGFTWRINTTGEDLHLGLEFDGLFAGELVNKLDALFGVGHATLGSGANVSVLLGKEFDFSVYNTSNSWGTVIAEIEKMAKPYVEPKVNPTKLAFLNNVGPLDLINLRNFLSQKNFALADGVSEGNLVVATKVMTGATLGVTVDGTGELFFKITFDGEVDVTKATTRIFSNLGTVPWIFSNTANAIDIDLGKLAIYTKTYQLTVGATAYDTVDGFINWLDGQDFNATPTEAPLASPVNEGKMQLPPPPSEVNLPTANDHTMSEFAEKAKKFHDDNPYKAQHAEHQADYHTRKEGGSHFTLGNAVDRASGSLDRGNEYEHYRKHYAEKGQHDPSLTFKGDREQQFIKGHIEKGVHKNEGVDQVQFNKVLHEMLIDRTAFYYGGAHFISESDGEGYTITGQGDASKTVGIDLAKGISGRLGYDVNYIGGKMKVVFRKVSADSLAHKQPYNESSHKDYMQKGLVHPEWAKGKTVGDFVNCFAKGGFEPISGTISKLDGGNVEIQSGADKHCFKIQSRLNESEDGYNSDSPIHKIAKVLTRDQFGKSATPVYHGDGSATLKVRGQQSHQIVKGVHALLHAPVKGSAYKDFRDHKATSMHSGLDLHTQAYSARSTDPMNSGHNVHITATPDKVVKHNFTFQA